MTLEMFRCAGRECGLVFLVPVDEVETFTRRCCPVCRVVDRWQRIKTSSGAIMLYTDEKVERKWDDIDG